MRPTRSTRRAWTSPRWLLMPTRQAGWHPGRVAKENSRTASWSKDSHPRWESQARVPMLVHPHQVRTPITNEDDVQTVEWQAIGEEMPRVNGFDEETEHHSPDEEKAR